MYKIWLIKEQGWVSETFSSLDSALAYAEDLRKPCSIQEFDAGRYVAILEVNA